MHLFFVPLLDRILKHRTYERFLLQFTLGTESLNGIVGTLRPQNYDSQSTSVLGGFSSDLTGNRYVPQTGDDPTVGDKAGSTGTGLLYSSSATQLVPFPPNSHLGWYHTFLSGEQPAGGAGTGNFGATGAWTANYQVRYM